MELGTPDRDQTRGWVDFHVELGTPDRDLTRGWADFPVELRMLDPRPTRGWRARVPVKPVSRPRDQIPRAKVKQGARQAVDCAAPGGAV